MKRYKEKEKLKLIDVDNELKPDELKSDDVYIILISISEDQVAKSS